MSSLFFKHPFEVLRIAANGELTGVTADIQCKSSDTILKWIHNARKRDGDASENREFSGGMEAREILLEYVREGIITIEHPVFNNWPKPESAGLKTALNRKNLISEKGKAKKIYVTEIDPVIEWEEYMKSMATQNSQADQPSSLEDGPISQVLQQSPQQSPQQSQLIAHPVDSSQKTTNNQIQQYKSQNKTPKNSELNETDLSKLSAGISDSLDRKMSGQLKAVHALFVTSSTKFSEELKLKASQEYVKTQVNALDRKINELSANFSAIINIPKTGYQNTDSPITDENSSNIKLLTDRLDRYEEKIARLEEQVFPEVTNAFIATQIDLYMMARTEFRNAINGQKRAGLLYITLPIAFFNIRENKPNIFADAVADAIGISFYLKSKVTTNRDKTTASVKIQISSHEKGYEAFTMVDNLLGRRRELQQNQGILLRTSVVQRFHYLNVLRHWTSTKIIFAFENTTGGQYRIYIGDGEDQLTTAKARNESCTFMIVENPGMLFKLKNPSVEILLKIHSGEFFPADNGHIYEIPADKKWVFENQHTATHAAASNNPTQHNTTQHKQITNQRNTNQQNQIMRNTQQQLQNQSASLTGPKPAILQTKPLSDMAVEIKKIGEANRQHHFAREDKIATEMHHSQPGNTCSQDMSPNYQIHRNSQHPIRSQNEPTVHRATQQHVLTPNEAQSQVKQNPETTVAAAAVAPNQVQNDFMSQILEIVKQQCARTNPQLMPVQSPAQNPAHFSRS